MSFRKPPPYHQHLLLLDQKQHSWKNHHHLWKIPSFFNNSSMTMNWKFQSLPTANPVAPSSLFSEPIKPIEGSKTLGHLTTSSMSKKWIWSTPSRIFIPSGTPSPPHVLCSFPKGILLHLLSWRTLSTRLCPLPVLLMPSMATWSSSPHLSSQQLIIIQTTSLSIPSHPEKIDLLVKLVELHQNKNSQKTETRKFYQTNSNSPSWKRETKTKRLLWQITWWSIQQTPQWQCGC